MRQWEQGAAALAVLLSAAATAAQPTVADNTLTVDTVLTALDAPSSLAFLGPDDFLFLEKNTGRVRRVVGGVLQSNPVLDVAVNFDNERGLLGIAINGESPPRVFLYYTAASDPDGDGAPDVTTGTPLGNRVYRYTWNAATAHLDEPQLILDLPATPGPNHNGGVLTLGPAPMAAPAIGDGRPLFVVIGDLNRGGQLENVAGGAAPDDSAVILRVQQDGSAMPGNPFVPYCSGTTTQTCANGGGCPGGQTCRTAVARYYAYGIRNSFGLAVDPITGDLWDTENGPGSYDEINRVPPGFNSGWLPIMGPDGRDPEGTGNLFAMPGGASAYSDPEYSWLSPVAVTGLVFPSGGALGPAYDSVALVGDFNTGQLYRLPLNEARTGFDLADVSGLEDLVADNATERNLVRLGSGFGGISDLERAPDGSIYIAAIGSGAIYRLRALDPPTPTPTLTPTPTPYAVSGSVRYWFGADRAVPDVVVAATGAGQVAVNTDSTGAYTAAPLPAGEWTLTPSRTGGINLGLSTLDATYILERVAGMRPFGPSQLVACDATGDGTCSTLDAVRILELKAGIRSRLPAAVTCDSDWLFQPVPGPAPFQTLLQPMLRLNPDQCQMGAIVFDPLVGSAGGQTFIGVLIGDVTGNWTP
jgi:glucose/arabinose dehydrogenase